MYLVVVQSSGADGHCVQQSGPARGRHAHVCEYASVACSMFRSLLNYNLTQQRDHQCSKLLLLSHCTRDCSHPWLMHTQSIQHCSGHAHTVSTALQWQMHTQSVQHCSGRCTHSQYSTAVAMHTQSVQHCSGRCTHSQYSTAVADAHTVNTALQWQMHTQSIQHCSGRCTHSQYNWLVTLTSRTF